MSESTRETPFEEAVERIRDGSDSGREAEHLLAQLSEAEKLWLLDGDEEFWPGMAEMTAAYNASPVVMGRIDRVGIPGLRFSDGPRGVVMGCSTAFPVSMARGATWDIELEERIGRAIGAEMRAQGGNFFGGVCINLPRHPAWGRAQETYGEDPLLLGELGAALVRGVKRHGMAVAKHFAVNSMENARFRVDVTVDDAALHEVYLPHFRRVVEEGVDGVMTAYNSVNGEWAGQNEHLMEAVLRGEWGFQGVTVSDFIFGLRNAALSLTNGLDVEEPFRQQRAQHLPTDLAEGRASWSHVDRAALRIIATQLRFHASELDVEPDPDVVFSAAHRLLARQAAAESVVLLKNEPYDGAPVLPLNPTSVTSIAVIGRLAGIANTGDHGSSNVRSPEVVTALDGIRTAFTGSHVLSVLDGDTRQAAEAAAAADVAIVVVGYTAADEGEYLGQDTTSDPALLALFPPTPEGAPTLAEMMSGLQGTNVMGESDGGDRASLRLRPADVETIRATAAANPRTVVIIVTAGAVITEEWQDLVPSIVIGWYNGSEGGHGLADALLGRSDITGRLPYSIPVSEEDLPFFDQNASSIVYDKWFGQRLLDKNGTKPAFPLGFGLSFTTFTITELTITETSGEHFTATVAVKNTGNRRGRHVVQLYATLEAEDFPSRVLVGFAPIWIDAGKTATVLVTGSFRPTQRWSEQGFAPAASAVTIEAASFSGDPAALTAAVTIH